MGTSQQAISRIESGKYEGFTLKTLEKLQIPPNKYRCHYVMVRVMLHRYRDGSLAVFHGPRKLADYDRLGKLLEATPRKAA